MLEVVKALLAHVLVLVALLVVVHEPG